MATKMSPRRAAAMRRAALARAVGQPATVPLGREARAMDAKTVDLLGELQLATAQ